MTDNVRGILIALVATAFFTIVAAMAKVAIEDYHALQILFFRQVIILITISPLIIRQFPGSLKTSRPKVHGIRLLGAFTALSMGIWALSVLPLSTAITLGFAQVLFVALLASKFLNEKVGVHRLLAVAVGFFGVVVVMRPGVDGLFNIYALIPVVGAFAAAIAVMSVRTLSQTESTETLLAYQSLFVGALAGLPLVLLWQTPTWPDFWFLVLMGLFAGGAQWLGVMSLRLVEASVVGNIEYVKMVYAALLGYWVFAEVPDGYTIVGAIIIVTSSLYIVHRENVNRVRT